MFAKNKVSQSMIDAVNSVINESNVVEASEKVPTSTGMKVYGSSYGNSAKARADQTKSAVDTLKGPKAKDLELKPHEKKMQEDLKGNQSKIDANHNNKIDAQDFKILRAKKKVSEESEKEEGHEDAKQDKAMIKKMINKSEKEEGHEDAKQDKALIKKIADKEADKKVKGHENRLHKSHVKENIFYNFAKQLQEDKSKGTEPTFTDNNIGETSGYSAKAARAGKDIGKPGKAFAKIAAGAAKRYGSEEKGKKVAGAILANLRKEEADADWSDEDVNDLLEAYEEVYETIEESTPKKNQDIADKAYLKHKPGTLKGQLTQMGRFLRGKPEIKESVQTQATKTGDKITTDMLTGREKGGKLNSFKNYKVDLTTSGVEAVPKEFDTGEDTREKQKITTTPGPVDIKTDDKLGNPKPQKYFSNQEQITSEEVRGELKVLRNKAKAIHNQDINIFNKKVAQKEEIESVEEKVIAGMSGFKKIKGADEKGNVTDKSGAVHTPMSRAKDAAKLSFAKLKQEMLGKISN